MKSAIFLADGFETCEALITVDMFHRAGQAIDMVSIKDTKEVITSQSIHVLAEKLYSEIDVKDYDVLILPGGKVGTDNLDHFEPLKKALREHFEEGKLTCAICAAPSVLGHLGILTGKKYTCFPGFESESYGGEYQLELAVQDENVITARGMGATIEFARTILKNIADETAMKKMEYGMQYEHSYRDLI